MVGMPTTCVSNLSRLFVNVAGQGFKVKKWPVTWGFVELAVFICL